MLLYSEQQQTVLRHNRRAFNAAETRMSELHGETFIGNASPLPRDVWGEWDREAVSVQRDELVVFNDLAAAAQTPMDIGKLIHYFQTVSESGEVNVSLDGRSKARPDQPVIEYHGTPIPIVDSGYSYSWRQMRAAETENYQLDAAGRDNSNRRVAERMETAALTGYDDVAVGGQKSYGILNHPKRNQRATGVTLNGASGAEWIAEIVATLKLLHDNNYRVGATLYLNWDDWFYASTTEFAANYPKTILQRVQELAGVDRIVPAPRIPANDIVALVRDRRVIDVLAAMPISTRAKFRANPEDDYEFVVMGAAALEIKFDAEDNCGLAVSS